MKSSVVLLLSTLALGQNRPIAGLQLSGLQFANGIATITVANTSHCDITGYSLGISARLRDGSQLYSERTEDFGPIAVTHKALHPGETSEQVIPYDNPEVQSVGAEVIVVIYDDQTAEVKNERTFQDTIRTRRGIATAIRESVTVFKAASADTSPRERAKRDFDQLMRNHGSNKANLEFLRSSASVAASAPSGHEREYLREHASILLQKAEAFERYGEIMIWTGREIEEKNK